MKNILLVVAFLAFGLSVMAQENLPELNLKTVDGEKIKLQDYASNGKNTVFAFWATWCAPCKKELNNIAEIYEDWKSDFNTEVIAVSVDNQRSVAKVKTYIDGQAWDYDVLLDTNQELMRALSIQNVPYTVVVDASGNISYTHSGYADGDEYDLEAHLESLNTSKE